MPLWGKVYVPAVLKEVTVQPCLKKIPLNPNDLVAKIPFKSMVSQRVKATASSSLGGDKLSRSISIWI